MLEGEGYKAVALAKVGLHCLLVCPQFYFKQIVILKIILQTSVLC